MPTTPPADCEAILALATVPHRDCAAWARAVRRSPAASAHRVRTRGERGSRRNARDRAIRESLAQ